MSCPTVKVKCDNEQGFYIINESDFDEKNHNLFVESDSEEIKKGSKAWYGAKLTDKGIEFDVDAPVKKLKELLKEDE